MRGINYIQNYFKTILKLFLGFHFYRKIHIILSYI